MKLKVFALNALIAFMIGFGAIAFLLAGAVISAYTWDCFDYSITKDRIFERPDICSKN